MNLEQWLTNVTLLALLVGVVWNGLQIRSKYKESIEKETKFKTNLTRDIEDIKKDLGNGTGLKKDVRDLKDDLQKTARNIEANLTKCTNELDGRIKVVETRLEDHIAEEKKR